MKIRSSFVSNSSTSSYIFVGFRAEYPEGVDDIWDWAEDNDIEYLDGSDDGVDGLVLGKMIATWDDCDAIDDKNYSLQDLLEEFKALESKRDKFAPDSEIRLYQGTRCS